jgi:hypothetical protein
VIEQDLNFQRNDLQKQELQQKQEMPRRAAALTLKQFWSEEQFISELTEANDAEILHFFDSVGMSGGGFTLLMKRNPHYFDLLRCRGGRSSISGLRDRSGKLVGTGTMTSTPSFVAGRPANTVYLCDLRVDCPDREVAKTWKAALGRMLRDGPGIDGHGDNPYLVSVIIEGNDRARRLLEEKSHGGQKLFPLARYSMITLFMKKPFSGQRKAIFKVENEPCLEETETFLHSVHSKQAFGFRFDAPFFELRRRLKTWEGLSMKDFYVVRDKNNKIIGSTALWNPNHCKQTVILGPVWTKPYNWIARLFNLPEFGKPVEIVYMTHLSFSWDLSEEQRLCAFQDMMKAVWPEIKRRKAHGLAFCDFKEFSLASAVSDFFTAKVPVKMYLALAENEVGFFDRTSLGKFPPAFEMALV